MKSGVGVELENLWIRFGDFTAVKNASVKIEEGKAASDSMFRDREINLSAEHKEREFEEKIADRALSAKQSELARRDAAASAGIEGFMPDPFEEEMQGIETVIAAFIEAQQQQNAQNAAALEQLSGALHALAQAQLTPKEAVYEKGRLVGSRPVGEAVN